MAEEVTKAIQEAYRVLDASARSHNRARSFHRKQAQEARQAQTRLEEVCRELGIKLEYQSKSGGT